MKPLYDIVFVGAGISTISALIHLAKNNYNGKILVIERGKPINERNHRLFGAGGAGAFSDFKLSISKVKSYRIGYSLDALDEYIDTFIENFINDYNEFIDDEGSSDYNTFTHGRIMVIPNWVAHFGDNGRKVISEMIDFITHKLDITILYEDNASFNSLSGISTKHLVLAVGRSGGSLIRTFANKYRIKSKTSFADIGVRIEFPSDRNIIDKFSYDPKLLYITRETQDRVRTFCANLINGIVVREEHDDVITVNGYSPKYSEEEDDKINLSNVALLVSMKFTDPHRDINDWMRNIAQTANLLSNGSVVIQRISDIRNKKRSTIKRINELPFKPTLSDAEPGDLSLILPKRILDDIMEFIDELEPIFNGIAHGVAYGVEAKFYANQVEYLDNVSLVKEFKGKKIHIIGDCSGHTRSIMGAALHGIAFANNVIKGL